MAGEVTNEKIEEIDDTKKWKFTADTIKKLEEAFAMDCTIEEACLLANITAQTYYNWIKENEELKERFEILRETMVLQARKIVRDKMHEDYRNAMDYLKRKKKKEFGDNMDLTTGGKPLKINIERYGGGNKDLETT